MNYLKLLNDLRNNCFKSFLFNDDPTLYILLIRKPESSGEFGYFDIQFSVESKKVCVQFLTHGLFLVAFHPGEVVWIEGLE